MREELIAVGLWDSHNPNNPSVSITAAWQVLSRVGAAYRYLGRTTEGDFEYLVYNPRTGSTIAHGRGATAPLAMCVAALEARKAGMLPS